MPSWTLADIVSAATQGLGNRGDVGLSDASFWANEAQRQVWDSLPHELQEGIAISSTTSNEDKITLPSDFQELLSLSNLSQQGGPDLIDAANIDDVDSWTTALGTPTHYMRYASWLELRPSPDSAYSIQMRYRKQLSDMTETTSVPSVGTRYRYAVMLKTKEFLASHVVRDPFQAAEAQADYLQYMDAMPSDRAYTQRENRFFSVSLPRKRGDTPGTTTLPFDRRDE
jgi:hypothetical protein